MIHGISQAGPGSCRSSKWGQHVGSQGRQHVGKGASTANSGSQGGRSRQVKSRRVVMVMLILFTAAPAV